MIALDQPQAFTHNAHLRPLDVNRDLLGVADLIEQCFVSSMDADGQEYLRQIRRMARDASFLRWASSLAEKAGAPMNGFVWEDEGQIVGNLSLIPLVRQRKRVYLIANVAVRPEYRRRGIASLLTQAGIEYSRQHGGWAVWLQVRTENTSAYHIYTRLGFVERARRTTWQRSPRPEFQLSTLPEAIVTPRYRADWPQQEQWLQEIYPPHITWNLPIELARMRPGLLNSVFMFLNNEPMRHWAARSHGRLVGVLTWQPSHSYADHLWLATQPEYEEQVIRTLLPQSWRDLHGYRAVSLNYPAGRAAEAFASVGFEDHQTLAWMEIPLRSSLFA